MKHTVKTILFIGLALIALFGMTGCPQNQSFGKPVDPALILRTDGYGKITGCKCAKEELPAALVIPAKIGNEEIKEIGSAAFAGYTGLTSLDLSGCTSLTTIGESAFPGCTGLNEVKLPANLTKINNGAFSGCTGLTSLDLSGYTSLTTIGESAFKFCMGLTEIKLPANLTKIGCGAFIYCINLTSAVFANTNGWKVYEYGGGSYIGSISSSNLAVPATAAKYLRKEVSDGGYCDKYWKKD